jgi:hypothetical protein
MKNWTQRSLTVPGRLPLGGPAGRGPPNQMALREQAAPLRGVPGQHGPAHVDVIPGKALVPTAIQAMVGFERPHNRLNGFCRKFSFEAMCGMISLDDQPCIIEEHDDGDQF